MGANLSVLLSWDGRGGQRRFLSLSGNSVEQASLALLSSFLSGNLKRGLVLLRGGGRTEFIRNPVEGVVEHSKQQAVSVQDLGRTGLHAPPTRDPLYVR